MADGEIMNRTVLVRGFEGDERDLLRAVSVFGSVVDLTLHPYGDGPHCPHFAVGGFVGSADLPPQERGSNRIADPAGSNAAHVAGDGARAVMSAHQQSLIWTMDMPGQLESADEFPRVDPRAKEKALQCCESMVLKRLSSDVLILLARQSFIVKALPGQELFVQGDNVKYLFVLISGVVRVFARFPMEMRACEGLYEDEIIVGPVSGTGQPLGETDYLR